MGRKSSSNSQALPRGQSRPSRLHGVCGAVEGATATEEDIAKVEGCKIGPRVVGKGLDGLDGDSTMDDTPPWTQTSPGIRGTQNREKIVSAPALS
jgi:hypothetical protein